MGYAKSFYSPPYFPYAGKKAITASETLTSQDAGKIILLDSTTAITVTLPVSSPATKGRFYTIFVKQVTGSGQHSVAAASGDGLAFKGGAYDAATCSFSASDAVGDFVTFVDDGAGVWHAVALAGTLA